MTRLVRYAGAALLVLVLVFAAVVLFVPFLPLTAIPHAPMRRVSISLVMPEDRDRLFGELQNFARKDDFTYRISSVYPDTLHFLIVMNRGNLEVVADNTVHVRVFDISLDRRASQAPTTAELDRITGELKVVAGRIPGAQFSVVRNNGQ